MRIVKSKICNINKNNINGVFLINNTKVFYKILNNIDFKREKKGYDLLKKHYNIPLLIGQIEDKNDENIIFYQYNELVKNNEGLLLDYFVKKESLDDLYFKIMSNFNKVFKNTINFCQYDNCKIFFEDRIKNRFFNNYKVSSSYNNKKIFSIYGDVIINVDKIYKDVKKYFNSSQKKWCVISQCDPNDLNICIDGMLFDFTGGGYVPIMAEFATYFWYNLCQCEYLSPKYNKKAFENHKSVYKLINKYNLRNDELTFRFRNVRIEAIIYYIEKVIEPIIRSIDYDNWYYDFKNYLAMKIMAVFNFKKMNKKDIVLSLYFLNLFYNKDFSDIDDFINYMKEWRNL